MNWNRFLSMVMLGATLALGNGCVALVVGAAAGAGAVVYQNGSLKSSEAIDFDKAYKAALAGVKDLNYAIVENTKDVVSAKITARAPGDKKVVVSLDKISGTVTEIKVRVGTLGDENHSKEILERIRKHF